MRLLVRHMKTGSQLHRLERLRANLHHFDHSPDFGDSETVAAIRLHLMMRIREAESAERYEWRRQSPVSVAVERGNQFELCIEAA